MKKTIICIAPTNHVNKVKNNPVTPSQIAKEVYDCYLNGATIAHLHILKESDDDIKNINKFIETIKLINDFCPILINIPTNDLKLLSGFLIEKTVDLSSIKFSSIQSGSLTLFDTAISITKNDFKHNVQNSLKLSISPEICIFDPSMIQNMQKLLDESNGKYPFYYGVYLGFPGQMTSRIEDICFISNCIGKDTEWFFTEYNKLNHLNIAQALILGAHIRVGFEDITYNNNNEEVNSNGDLVAQVSELSKLLGRGIANIDDTKKILNII